MEEKQLHVFIEGRVQGVGFRYFVMQQASRLQLRGWVRNLPDGRVETLAEGLREDLEMLLALLQRGPAGSSVRDLRAAWAEPSREFSTFLVRHY